MTVADEALPIERLGLDPTAVLAAARPPEVVDNQTDPRWRVVKEDPSQDTGPEPSGVAVGIANGQVALRLTQALSETSTVRVTTADVSGPYRLHDSAIHWQNASFPSSWGTEPDEVIARAILRGDDGTAAGYAIEVTFANEQITVSHTDADVTTVDFTDDLIPTSSMARTGESELAFRWLRIEANAAGTSFSVYASVDGEVWVLLVSHTMSVDMQAAFAHVTVEFSLTSSGMTGTGSWVIGAINTQPVALAWAGAYLQDENQCGFSYNGGIWAQFGAPLDGPRQDYTYEGAGQWRDAGGNLHYGWISGLAVAADDPNKLYAVVVNKDLLLVSNDGGFTWTQRVMSWASRTPPDVTQHRSDLDIFWLASPASGEILALGTHSSPTRNPGLYHSTNDGVSWTRIAEMTTYTDSFGTHVYTAGGMQSATEYVWWAQQTDESHVTPPSTAVPRYRVLWSGSMDWAIERDDVPEDQPTLTIPPLSGATSFTNDDGTPGTASFTLVTGATPGVWNPDLAGGDGLGVLWEDGMQSPWQNPIIDGIYGQVGAALRIGPAPAGPAVKLFWQPGAIPDANVLEYWYPPPPTDPPTPGPDLGWYVPGSFQPMHLLTFNDDLPEPVNSAAGLHLSGTGLHFDQNAVDYMSSVTPHRPENSASVYQGVFPSPGADGATLRVAIYDRVYGPTPAEGDERTEELKAVYEMSGTVSAIVLDVEPDDLELWLQLGGAYTIGAPRIHDAGGTPRAFDSGTWQIVSGAPGYTYPSSALIGPPGFEETIEYTYYEHPTYVWQDIPNFALGEDSITLTPAGTYSRGAGGTLFLTIVTFGGDTPPVPDGWTLVADTDVTVAGSSGAIGGEIPNPSHGPAWGMWMRTETGAWPGGSPPGVLQWYRLMVDAEVTYDLTSLRQATYSLPISWNTDGTPEPVTIPLPEIGQPYWVMSAAAGVYGMPPGADFPSYAVNGTTWAIKRAHFDGTAAETVASFPFTMLEGEPGDFPGRLQVRAFSDELCLVSSYARNAIYRIASGQGAVNIWSPGTTARVWDAIALDATTFVAVAEPLNPEGWGTVLVFRTTDAGVTWTQSATIARLEGFAERGAVDSYPMLGAVPGSTQHLVMMGAADFNIQQLIWMSDDGGLSWTQNPNYADPYERAPDGSGSWLVFGPGGLVAVPGHAVIVTTGGQQPQATILG